ncbi:MAG: AtpZ/AtpI family protein [Halothermotrichaceae bacterium]
MKREDYNKVFRALGMITYLGLVMVANLAVGFFIGYLLDYYLPTGFIFRFIGLMVGIVSGFYYVYKLIIRIIGDNDDIK